MLFRRRPGALDKALEDPRVGSIARSLHLDLQDPATVNQLLAITQKYVDSSSEVSPGQKQLLWGELAPGISRHVRETIRKYLEIAGMN